MLADNIHKTIAAVELTYYFYSSHVQFLPQTSCTPFLGTKIWSKFEGSVRTPLDKFSHVLIQTVQLFLRNKHSDSQKGHSMNNVQPSPAVLREKN